MSKWRALLITGLFVWSAGCGGAPVSTSTTAPLPTASNPTSTSTPALVQAPTLTPAPSSTAEATLAATATAQAITHTGAATSTLVSTVSAVSQQDFAPTVRQVWNTSVGLDQMTGTCSKGSMLPVYGLVQITPEGDKLSWKNQEPAPYTFTRLRTNVYQYSGPTAIKDGVVTMTLKFDSTQSLEMLRQFVASDDPGCLHTHKYTGTFQWNK